MENQEIIKQELLKVCFDVANDKYTVEIPQGSSVSETAFCMAVVIKCLARDGIIKQKDMLDAVSKYLDDPQYEEVKS